MLSRDAENVMTEHELQRKACDLMKKHKRVFVLCSSMNIDRIAGLIHARPDMRPVVCDAYQKEVLKYIEQKHGCYTELYRFGELHCNPSHILYSNIQENGCLAFIRANNWSKQLLDRYDDAKIIYSMWDGYLEGPSANQKLVSLLEGSNPEHLHTSGHAATSELQEVMSVLCPRKGIIPIHTEVPKRFYEIFPQYNVTILSDGKTILL